jgi:ATP-dependent Clp protease protease subunit
LQIGLEHTRDGIRNDRRNKLMTSKNWLAKQSRKYAPQASRADRRQKSESKPASRLLRPDPGPEIYSGFLPTHSPQWEVVLSGELEDKEGSLHEKLVELPRGSRGLIYFDSCGGSAFMGLALASLIRLRGLKATGVVVGECSSAALMPLAACAERYVTTHSTLLFHPIRWQSEEQVKLEEAAEWARHFRVMELDHEQLLARLFGCDVAIVRGWNNPGRFVSGEEMVAADLARMLDLFAGDVWQQIPGMGPRRMGS